MSRFAGEAPPLVERGCAPVIFVTGVGRVQELSGGNVQLTFCRLDDGRREVEVKLVCAKADAAVIVQLIGGALRGVPIAEEPETLRLM